jgi:hypothetical protein
MHSRHRPTPLVRAAPLGLLVAMACMRGPAPPGPGEARGFVPELRGQKVMVLPFQLRDQSIGDVDAELAFALQERAPSVEWMLPAEITAALRASPALDAPLTGLPVEIFLRTEVDRLGDPVYGVLRRLGAVTGADLVLLPVAAFLRSSGPGEPEAVQVSVALMDVRTGRALWYAVEAADGGPGDAAALAAVMDALARRVAPRRVSGVSGPGVGGR